MISFCGCIEKKKATFLPLMFSSSPSSGCCSILSRPSGRFAGGNTRASMMLVALDWNCLRHGLFFFVSLCSFREWSDPVSFGVHPS